MAQIYNEGFAKTYNLLWKGWIEGIAPDLLDFISEYSGIKINTVLDLCCGTGQLVKILAANGFQVTGLDISPAMLELARQNNAEHIEAGIVQFKEADATRFKISEPLDCIISTYDSINHLEDLDSIKSCFESTFESTKPGGVFIFDLNTRKGLKNWSGIQMNTNQESVVITRGVVSEVSRKAYTQITAFIKTNGNLYERVEQSAFNSIFNIQDILQLLSDSGWRDTYCAVYPSFSIPVADPENQNRVFIITRK